MTNFSINPRKSDTDYRENKAAQTNSKQSLVCYGPSIVTAIITGEVTSRPLIRSMDSIFS